MPVGSPTKPRPGCLGCLVRAVFSVALAICFGLIVVAAVTALLFPWSFYLGGKFHVIPGWQGSGTLHAKSGDYVLFIRFQPTTRGSRMYAASNLSGQAFLCTPRGERFPLRLTGSMRPYLHLSTDAEPISLGMHSRPWYANFVHSDSRPVLSFRGAWRNPNLVLDDQGSIAKAFQPDGTLVAGPIRSRNPPEVLPLTLTEGSYSDFKSACAAVRR